jgi:NAD(P)-dependent dehydrogenase (short-subunit alcohol dehydrogenase family)
MRIIVTGSNSGVGKAAAGVLAAAGHGVVLACRTIPKAEQAAAEMAGDVEVSPRPGRPDQRAQVRRLGGNR